MCLFQCKSQNYINENNVAKKMVQTEKRKVSHQKPKISQLKMMVFPQHELILFKEQYDLVSVMNNVLYNCRLIVYWLLRWAPIATVVLSLL